MSPRPAPSPAFDPARLKGRRACVLGLGLSGLAAARLLARRGARVVVSDAKAAKELEFAGKLPRGTRLKAGGHGRELEACDFAVKSPGIPNSSPALERLRRRGTPVLSELELGLAFCRPRDVVAVSGTNGKTTTAALTAAMFAAAGRRALCAGNIGTPLCDVARRVGPQDALILEVSSYQLEDSRRLRPNAAALLNVSADHLDHHGSMRAYLEAKARLFKEQGSEDVCVFNADDPIVLRLSRACRARKLFFSLRPSPLASAWVSAGKLRLRRAKGAPLALPLPKLPGEHNLQNALAAALLAHSRGVGAAALAKALRAFKGVEHRLEECGRARGLRCINDSKATNVDSTLVALKSLAGESILLILGGLAKAGGFKALSPWLGREVKGILAIGSASRKIEEDLAGSVPIFPCRTLEQAVDVALRVGAQGDVLLLSPACASQDQFKNFEERGRLFKKLLLGRGLAR